jgi:uncharacterized membrane protein
MKPNTFYLILGLTAAAEVGIFWASIELNNPFLIQVSFILGVIIVYLAKQNVQTGLEDERTQLIAQKSALRTLEVFWVVFFVMSLGSIVIGFNRPLGFRPPHIPLGESRTFGMFGFAQLALLCLMILLYIGFRIYYSRKYGASEADEE